ncbi:MAG: leucine-rich repeat protein [Clostridia bacterium]
MKKLNIRFVKNKKGITLVALVVTIVVLLILAGVSLNLLIGNNGIITRTQISKVSQELAAYKENMNLFIGEKQVETPEFNANTLTAYKNKLYYNTKSVEDTSGIETVLGTVNNKYIEKIEIINGEICLNTTNSIEQKAAEGLGIKVNLWDVVDGVLLSSDKNLGLINNGETVVIPPSIKKIGDGAFSSVNNIKKIVIPGTVEEIGANAFSNNTTLEEVTIEYGVKKVGDYAFCGCSNLKSIEFPDSVTEIGYASLLRCVLLENIKLPSKITSINAYTMAYTNISEIDVTEGITSINGYAFEGCPRLEKVKIPATLNRFDVGVFWNVKSLKNIIVDEKNESFKFQNGLLLSKDGKIVYFGLLGLTEVTIPEGVTEIKGNSFVGSEATTISLPNSLENISGGEFTGMKKLKEIKIKPNNENYKVDKGNLYTKNGEDLIKYVADGDTIVVPEGVKTIRTTAIEKDGVKELKLPSTLENLNNMSLSSIGGLQTVNIPKNVRAFRSSALPKASKVVVDESNPNIKSVDDSMILSKDGKKLYAVSQVVENFNIPTTVESIEIQCFYMHNNISEITVPEGVKEIKEGAFGYSNLKTINLPSTLESMKFNTFENCKKLTEIVINKSKDSISGSPWGCPIGDRAVKWTK